jgi:hypothetical protein
VSLRPLAALGQGATPDARPEGLAVPWTHLPPHLPASRQRGPGSVLGCPPLPECPGAVGLSSPRKPGRRLDAWRSRTATWFRLPPMACLAVGGQTPLRAGALRGPSGAVLRRWRACACPCLRPGTCAPASVFANPEELQLAYVALLLYSIVGNVPLRTANWPVCPDFPQSLLFTGCTVQPRFYAVLRPSKCIWDCSTDTVVWRFGCSTVRPPNPIVKIL